MIIKHNDIESESEKFDIDEIPPPEDCSDMEIAYPIEEGIGYKACFECTSQGGRCRSIKGEHLSY
jgi:hypothetical protein